MISFRLRTKWQNCRGYVPRYERPPKNGWFDIHSVFATHVETIMLLSRINSQKSLNSSTFSSISPSTKRLGLTAENG